MTQVLNLSSKMWRGNHTTQGETKTLGFVIVLVFVAVVFYSRSTFYVYF